MSKAGPWIGLAAISLMLLSPLAVRIAGASNERSVTTSPVERRQVRTSVIATGTFLYDNQVQLSPEVIGRVTDIPVKEGDLVHRGDVLLRIQDTTYQSAVAQQQASVAGARSLVAQRRAELGTERLRLARITTLRERGFAAESGLEDAQEAFKQASGQHAVAAAALNQSEELLRQAAETLRKTVIRAPTTGVIVSLPTRVGETVVPSSVNLAGSSLLTIAETSALVADVNVDEADIGSVATGAEVSLSAAAFPDHSIKGIVQAIALTPGRNDNKLLGIATNPSNQSRTYSVRVQLVDSRGLRLRSGMTCRAEIFSSGAGPRLTVPVEAVLTLGNDNGNASSDTEIVFVVNERRVQRKRVRLGSSDDAFQEIRTGLKAGDVVVTGPAETLHDLKDGDLVNVR